MSNVLIFVEHAEGEVKKSSLAAVTFGQELAKVKGGELHLALIGSNLGEVVDQARKYGAAKVHTFDNACFENYQAESYTQALVAGAKASSATMVAGATTSSTKDLMPRVAGELEAAMASDVMAVVGANQFKRPMWAGDVIATVELATDTHIATVRATEFDDPAEGGESPVEAHDLNVDLSSLKTEFISIKQVKSERPDATSADVVVAGGRGLKAQENFKLIEDLADCLNGGVGASRAICDAGWVPNDLQIGQTGKVVAPNLYFAIGISGAIQHLAGMKGSKVIVAINKDPDAPIFQVSDYGLVADLFDVVPELISSLK
ncbi:MAG: electron transfer flavoprotein subunit alpha/FixB family protein [Myxococcota bacterium]|nr:electron transfer flavoprotein subunit alpha/FixB family protein [Myxococcota bacterium]